MPRPSDIGKLTQKLKARFQEGGVRGVGEAIHRKVNARRLDYLAFSPTRRKHLTLTDPSAVTARESVLHALLAEVAATIPRSYGSHHFSPIPAKIGIVTDLYMYNFYKDVFEEVHYLSPTNYRDVLASHELDAVIYVTCWRGLHSNDWRHNAKTASLLAALGEIAELSHAQGIPFVFQSIEDPVNYEHFLPVARLADHVFTSDSGMIERYQADLGHERVYFGEYGVNPLLNNPIGSQRFTFPCAFFAGSFYPKYPKRAEDMAILFDSVLAAEPWTEPVPQSRELPPRARAATPDVSLTILGGAAGASSDGTVMAPARLIIADRNYGSDGFLFPKRYQPYTISAFSHEPLQQIHKLFAANLSVSSITDSPTMCAMRVYELQACGKLLISNYAQAVAEKFPHVSIVDHETDLSNLFTPEGLRDADRRAQRALTQIMAAKTSYHVVSQLCEKIGLPSAPHRPDTVLVLGRGDIDAVRQDFENQSYPHKLFREDAFQALRELEAGELPQVGYVTVMDSFYSYGRDYLQRRMNAFTYTSATFVTGIIDGEGSASAQAGAPEGTGLPAELRNQPAHEYRQLATNPATTVVSTASQAAITFMAGEDSDYAALGYAVDPYELRIGTRPRFSLSASEGQAK